MHGHLRAHKGFTTKRKNALKYIGQVVTTMALMGREWRETGLVSCGLFALQRHEALLRWRGEHGSSVLNPPATHRKVPSVTHSHPLTCRLFYSSPPSSCILPSFLLFCQVLITSLSQLLWYQHFLTGVYASVTLSKAL